MSEKENTMDANTMFDKLIKPEFDKLHSSIADLDKRIFKDNGNPCLQSKINSHDKWIKTIAGFGSVFIGAIIVVIVRWVWTLLT